MKYIKLVDGKVEFVRLADEFPQTINPHLLSDEELAPILRVEVVRDELDFCEKYGEPELTIDGVVKYPAVPLPLEEAKVFAWERVKAERTERQVGLMPYDYGVQIGVLHNEMTQKVRDDLTASTTAAIVLQAQGVTSPVMPWTVHENITLMLSPEQMLAFGVAALQRHSAIHMRSQQLRAAIEAAEDVVGVVAAAEWGEE